MQVDLPQVTTFLRGVHLFGKLDDEQMALVAQSVQLKRFLAGTTIYDIAAEPADFFIIYSGRVELRRALEGEDEYTATLDAGDFFGIEALDAGAVRQTAAAALDDTLLLAVDWDALRLLQQEIPALRMRLDMLARSFHLTWRLPAGWRDENEVIYYAARRHGFFLLARLTGPIVLGLFALPVLALQSTFLPGLVTPLLVSGFILAVAVLWFVWNFIDWSNDYYIITDRRVIYLERILWLYDSRIEAPLEAILNVSQRTTQIGRILGYGDVLVKSFTGTVDLANIAQPQEIQVLIERLLLRARSKMARDEQRTIARAIRERLSPHGQAKNTPAEEEPAEPEVKPGGIPKFLSNVFHTRFEENGIITYRKHWFVLLQQTWTPSVLLVGILALLIARAANVFTFLSMGSTLALLFSVGFLVGLWWLYQYVDWTNDIFIVTYDAVMDVDKKPLGTETRKTAPIKNILSINYERLGFTGYLLNFGTVYIKVGETTLTFDTVFNPSAVQRELFQRLSEYKQRERQEQADADRKRMADWIESYHRWQEQQEPPAETTR